jgi:predicted nucleotidyltransferase
MSTVHHLQAGHREAVVERLSEALATRSDILFAYAHGSFLHPDGFRDIDVGAWTGPGASERIDIELAAKLSRDTGYPVDVRVVNQAPVSFLFRVLRGRLLVVRDERLLADLIERTARAYHDRAPLLRRAMREAFA